MRPWLRRSCLPQRPTPCRNSASPYPEPAPELTEIEQLANRLRGAGEAARKVTVLGTAANESITLTALTLARLIARNARVVMVDLSSSPTIAAVSVDPTAPGLAELMLGEASFSQIITKDRLSPFTSSAPAARVRTARCCSRRG